jgi:capsular exopolysaccharide synthesis family protein
VSSLQQGVAFSEQAVRTYAAMASTPIVLDPVIERLRLRTSVDELAGELVVSVPTETTLIDITATSSNPREAAAIANAVATSMEDVIPGLTSGSSPTARPIVQLQQVQVALTPRSPVAPDPVTVLAIALVAGLFIGLAITVLRQAFDSRVRGSRDLAALTDVPMLAAIPHARTARTRPLTARDDSTGAAGEAFRTLRTRIRFLEASSRRSIVFAPVAEPRSGLPVATNLAWSLAQAGYGVTLVDANLRSPQVNAVLQVSSDVGLSDVLAGQAELTAAVQPTSHPCLSVILAGTRPPNPSELIGSLAMQDVLAALEDQSDYVIIQGPAVLSYTDSVVVGATAQRTVLTVEAGRTRSNQLSAALLSLAKVGVTPQGIVLTNVRGTGLDPGDQISPAERRRVIPLLRGDGSLAPGPTDTDLVGRARRRRQ